MALTTVVIPVKDEDPQILEKVVKELKAHGYPVIVVDDGSAEPMPFATLRFPISRGYGAALKAGIAKAQTDLVATMDGDGQHRAFDVKRLEDFFQYFSQMPSFMASRHFDRLDMVIADRRVSETGLRLLGRQVLNSLASGFAGRWIPDLNSGLRLFRRSVALGYFPILCEGFSFTTSITLSFLADGYAVDWLPSKIFPRQVGCSKVKMWRDGWTTLKYILWIGFALRTRRLRAWLRPLRPAVSSA